MSSREERRRSHRLARDEDLYVKIVASSLDSSLPGRIATCTTHNVSPDGLRIRLDRSVPAGCLLDLWISLRSHPGTLLLTGEVKWSEADGDSKDYFLGIELREQPGDDLSAWRRLVTEEITSGAS